MDVDGNNTGQGTPSGEIDTTFLQQFSCLGTTDHEELVSQLQKILGNQLTYSTARFFLDMNNWNLQAAVGCYFDFSSGQKLPSMQMLGDETVGGGEGVTPNTVFTQSWKVRNNGDEAWPYNCYLKCTSHNNETEIPVQSLPAGAETVISVSLISPNELGSFQTKWRLCTQYGSYFGDIMWSVIPVTESGTLSLTQSLNSLQTNQAIPLPAPPSLEQQQFLNMGSTSTQTTGAQPIGDDIDMYTSNT